MVAIKAHLCSEKSICFDISSNRYTNHISILLTLFGVGRSWSCELYQIGVVHGQNNEACSTVSCSWQQIGQIGEFMIFLLKRFSRTKIALWHVLHKNNLIFWGIGNFHTNLQILFSCITEVVGLSIYLLKCCFSKWYPNLIQYSPLGEWGHINLSSFPL